MSNKSYQAPQIEKIVKAEEFARECALALATST
jgi:hypothetical protein